MVVLLYKSGIPVKLTEKFSKLEFDIEGFLIGFTFKENTLSDSINYRFYFKAEFKINDKKRSDLIDAYYDETQFLKYIENTGPNIPLVRDMIIKYKFNFDKFVAKPGDSISVGVTNFNAPYDFFYDRKKYEFKIESTLDNKGVRSYSESTTEGLEKIDYILRLPSNFTSQTIPVPLTAANRFGYHFYNKNLGHYISQYSNDADKRKLKKIVILIIFKIREIVEEIFPILLNEENSDIILEGTANSDNTDLSGLSDLEKMAFLLKKSWGYYYDPNSILPHRSILEPIFNEQSSYSDFEYYYLGLVSFYDRCYKKPHVLSVFPPYIKYEYLLEILPINALSAIPVSIIKEKLLRFIKQRNISENEEQFIVRLVLAISKLQANDFLDFLLNIENGINTNFDCLYHMLDDARIERIPVANWFADEKTNRMGFVYAVYELWKVSKYNLVNSSKEINTESFFFNDGINFYKKENGYLKSVVLECGRISSVNSGDPEMQLQTNTWVNYQTDKTLKKELVTINKKIATTNLYLSTDGHYLGDAPSLDRNETIPNTYHLYQSLTLIGHQADDRTILPNDQPIPAFLFYYSDDFKRILKIDAKIALAVTIGIEVVLFFTLGGITQLKNLQYLKHITKIRAALSGELAATEEVLVWTGLEAGSFATSISASTIYALGQYNTIQLPTEEQRKAREDANKAFLYISLAFGGGTIYCRYKAVSAAEYALIDAAGTVGMPAEVKSIMQTLLGDKVNDVISFEQKLSTLPQLEGTNVIITRYTSYSDDLKRAFYRDFGEIKNSETKFWNSLNKTSTLDNWEELKQLDVLERNEISVVSSTARTDAYKNFYSDIQSREILERARINSRLAFLDAFGKEKSLFPKIIENPQKISEFINGNGMRQALLSEADYHWLQNGFNANQIEDLYIHFKNIRKKIKTPNKPEHNNAFEWIKDASPPNKEKAIAYLGNGNRVSVGDYIEKPAIDYIKRNLSSYEEGYVSVDIMFYKDNKLLHTSAFRDIDGLVYNNITGKFEKIYSCKFPIKAKTYWEEETGYLLAYGQIPAGDNIEMKNFFISNKLLKTKKFKGFDNINSFKFKMLNVKTNRELIMDATEFQQKVKNNYFRFDVIEIRPNSFNTTEEEILEGTYRYLHKKYNQTNSWD